MKKSLFPHNTRLPTHIISDLEYADDGLLFASTRDSMAVALQVFHSVTTDFGLSVNFTKTKFMGAGHGLTPEDCLDLPIGDAVVQHVSSFVYLGSVMTPDGRSSSDSNRRLNQASAAAFGDLRLVLLDNRLSLATGRRLYSACVLTVLLYGAECWTPRKSDLRSLDGFHHQCLRTILSISKERQKLDRITSSQLREMWGDPISVSE